MQSTKLQKTLSQAVQTVASKIVQVSGVALLSIMNSCNGDDTDFSSYLCNQKYNDQPLSSGEDLTWRR